MARTGPRSSPCSCHGKCQFQARNKGIFEAMAQAPVATDTKACGSIPEMALAQRFVGLGIAPAVHFGIGRFGADAGHFDGQPGVSPVARRSALIP